MASADSRVNAEDEVPAPAAYCAPGKKVLAELTLLLRGEPYSSITETPVLEGRTDVILAAPPVPLDFALNSLVVVDCMNQVLRDLGHEKQLAWMSVITSRRSIIQGGI